MGRSPSIVPHTFAAILFFLISAPCALAEPVHCKTNNPLAEATRAFDLIIDRGQKKLVKCYGSSDGIITNEFSEDLISASCPILGGKRSFKIDRRTGSFTATEEFVAPPSREEFVPPASRTYSGACEMSARSQPSVAEEQLRIIRSGDVSDPTAEQILGDKCERERPDDCEKQQREDFQTPRAKRDRQKSPATGRGFFGR
jgi:hypothetical protein